MKTISFLLAAFLSVNAFADSGTVIVDVRSEEEYQSGHIENALHQPYDSIDASIGALLPDKSQHIILYCGSGKRAGIAKETLEALGYSNVENVGGYEDLKARMEKPPGDN